MSADKEQDQEISWRGDPGNGHGQAANQRACQELGKLLMFCLSLWQENPERECSGEELVAAA